MKVFPCLITLTSIAAAASIDSILSIATGELQGRPRDGAGILSFLGIPFAAPPVGDLRWRSPQPVPKWNKTLDATQYGASCYSAAAEYPPPTPAREDCLSLNVWTPALNSNEKLPVMIWIYGGGFQFGSSAMPNYDGTALSEMGVVVVTFNYRLGALGFLALHDLDKEGNFSGNYGLQDQIAAIKWVKENIAVFGGDPENLTIWGESAGAHSVGLLMASPLTQGLFQKAIMESGAYWDSEHGSLETFEQARAKGSAFAAKLGARSISDLRELSAEEIDNAGPWNFSTDPGLTAFAPNIDKYVVPTEPAETFQSAKTQQVPLLAGFNKGEAIPFLSRALPHSTPEIYVQSASILFGSKTSRFLELYPGDTQSLANESAEALIGDLVISAQTFDAIDKQALASAQPVFAYYYTYTSPYSPVAAHSAEVNFVFGNLESASGSSRSPSPADVALSRQMMTYWTNFAKTGDPNDASNTDRTHWPRYTGEGADFLELGTNISAIISPSKERYQFLASLRRHGRFPLTWRDGCKDN
ncbi:Para-nitrobenzyl esterase [Talaromyces pinophilus]|nr:Para-nitrobenzyl esterase [Talaromyces pinophilus]